MANYIKLASNKLVFSDSEQTDKDLDSLVKGESSAHASRHESGGADVIDLSGLDGSGLTGLDWKPAAETWTFASVDDPTGVITVPSDARTKYSAGMRIKFTNGGNTIYGIITVVAETSITFLHEIDPTDSLALHLMASSAITANYYSTCKVPFGFPLNSNKWTVAKTDTTNRSQASPTQNTWYNLGSVSISIPIGLYIVKYSLLPYSYRIGSASKIQTEISLSTSNNSVSDSSMTIAQYGGLLSSDAELGLSVSIQRPVLLELASKTTYYIITRTITAGISSINNQNATQALYITATCAYL